MLNTAKQHGSTCLAFALFNAGIISLEARKEYEQMTRDAEFYIMRHNPFTIFGMDFVSDPIPDKYHVGGEEFARDWVMKYAPQMYAPLKNALWDFKDAGPAAVLAAAHKHAQVIPENGKGTLLITITDIRTNYPQSSHIVAYEDGKLVDSDAPMPHPETWEEYKTRSLVTHGWDVVILESIPLED